MSSGLRATVAAGAVLLTLSGCASSRDAASAPSNVRGLSMAAVLDPKSGAVNLPGDQFLLNEVDMDLVASAMTGLISTCAADKGVKFVRLKPLGDPTYLSESYFGPWTLEQAREFGFVPPMPKADLIANGIIPGDDAETGSGGNGGSTAERTEEEYAVVDECAASVDDDVYTAALTERGPWVQLIKHSPDKVRDTTAFRDAVRDLDTCYEQHGLTPSGQEPWTPLGAKGDHISLEQIEMAVQVVECKNEVDFTARVANAQAALQAPVIEKYADEMFAHRTQMATAIKEARKLHAEMEAAGK